MKQWTIQRLFLNSSLGRSAFIAGGFLWGVLLLPAAYIILSFQLSSISSIEAEKRNSIQELLSNSFISKSRYGDLVNARGMVLKIGKPLGLIDLGICINGADANPRAFENRCLHKIPEENTKSIESGITLRFYWSDLKVNWNKIVLKTILLSLFFSFLMFLLTSIFYYHILKKRIHFLSHRIANENAEESNPQENISVPEMQPILHALKEFRTKVNQYHKEKQQLESQAVFASIAKQVSHDIRSPLSALNLIMSDLSQIPEERRILIRNAVQRINDISNQLLEKSKRPKSQDDVEIGNKADITATMLSSLVDEVVSEKRISCREKIGVSIDFDIKDSYGLFSKICSVELKRVLSNLLNNSIEALSEKNGKINIALLEGQDNTVSIIIQDNGKGIPDHVLNQLGSAEVSFNKEGTQSGSGLGFLHAKRTVESFGGRISISSIIDIGTTVTIHLPITKGPSWFTESLQIFKNQLIVVLDDDQSIHNIWEQRLSPFVTQGLIENLISFTSAQLFKNWVETNTKTESLFLIDYELLNQDTNGLQLIEDLRISNSSILVSGRYDEVLVRNKCESLNVKMIPKGLAGFIPIEIQKERNKIDCCLIDDDNLVREAWLMAARESNKSINVFGDYAEFKATQQQISRSTPIYIDSNLGNGVRGEDIAINIFKMGFQNLYLATGYEPASIAQPNCIKKIVGKDFPASI